MRKTAKYHLGQRRTLAWAAAGWALVQLSLAAAIELAAPEMRDPEYAVRERRLLARLAEGRRLRLMLGSSRTQLGLRASQISATDNREAPIVFNFGMPGCGPLMQAVCFERLLARGVRPDSLVIEVNPALLSHCGGEPLEERMLDGARLSPAELIRVLPAYQQPRRAFNKWLWAWLASCRRRAAELRRLAGLDAPTGQDAGAADYLMDDYGWQFVPAPTDAERRAKLTKLAADQYDGALARFEPAPGPRRALEALLARCRRESIPAVLVLMPEGTSFERLYGSQSEPALQDFLATLRDEYGVALIDARRWIGDESFSDGHHLLPEGAADFSDRFARELPPLDIVADGGARSKASAKR